MTTSLPAGRRVLDELYQVGLLQEIRPGRYAWHILVRAYAPGYRRRIDVDRTPACADLAPRTP